MQKSYKPNLLLCPLSIASHNQNQVITVLPHCASSHINHYTDIKLHQHTESSLAKQAPSIKQMVTRYNSLVEEAKKRANAADFPLHLLPQPLDITKLYDLDANPHMWMIDAIPTDASQLPPYIADGNVQCGIASLLVQDHVKEEIFRLQEECGSMIKWLDIRIHHLKATIMQCHGMYSSFLCGNQGPLEYKDKG